MLGGPWQGPGQGVVAPGLGVHVESPRQRRRGTGSAFGLAGPVQCAKLTDFARRPGRRRNERLGTQERPLNGVAGGEGLVELLGEVRGDLVVDRHRRGDDGSDAARKEGLHLRQRGAAVQEDQLQPALLAQELRQAGGVGHLRRARGGLQLQLGAAGMAAVVQDGDAVGVAGAQVEDVRDRRVLFLDDLQVAAVVVVLERLGNGLALLHDHRKIRVLIVGEGQNHHGRRVSLGRQLHGAKSTAVSRSVDTRRRRR